MHAKYCLGGRSFFPVVVLSLTIIVCAPATAGTFDAWTHRMTVTFSGYDKPETLTNFPVLVVLSNNVANSGFTYADFASATGEDLRFAASNETTELNYEIEHWDTNGTSYVWVQVPELVDTNTLIYAYWGNAVASQPAYTTNGAVWAANYVGVWHMNQVNAQDSTANAFHGTAAGTGLAVTEAGMIGAAVDTSTANHITVPDSDAFTLGANYTVSAWIKSDAEANYEGFVGTHNGSGFIFTIFNTTANQLQFWAAGTWRNSSHTIPDGEWKHVAYTASGTDGRFYVDGVQVATVAGVAVNNGGALHLGAAGTSWGSNRYDGLLDEVRISSTPRGTNWIWASWLNQASNTQFVTYSDAGPVSTVLAVKTLSPTPIGPTHAMLNGQVLHTGEAENPEVYVCWASADAGTASGTSVWANVGFLGTNWGRGEAFSTNVSGLISGSNYAYRCYVTNSTGEAWSVDAPSFQTVTLPAVTNLGPINGAVASVLRGEVTDTGTEAPDVNFLWWEEVAAVTSTVPMGVQDGVFSTAVGGLDAGKTYHYRMAASNAAGTVWSHTEAFWSVAGSFYVSTNGNGSAGASWDTAFTNIHDALAVAASNDTIYLAGQTFAITQQLAWTAENLTLKGGYAATNSADTPGPRDPDRWPTVITRDTAFGNMRLLYLHTVTDVTLDGITFQGGYHATSYGGGLYLESVTGLQLRNARVHSNYVGAAWGNLAYGGGLYAKTVSGLISNVVFSANWAQGSGAHRSGNGGGAYIEGGALTLRDTLFLGNTSHGGGAAHGNGGGIFFYSGSHTVHNTLLVHNRGVYDGGTFIPPSPGGGIYVRSGVTLLVENATIFGSNSDGIHNLSANTTVRNSILYRNRPDIGGTQAPTQSNNLVGTDPLFDDNWFYLGAGSPAIGAGDRSVADAGLTGYTTRADGTADTGDVDLGYHYTSGLSAFEQWYVSRNNGNDAWDGTGWGTAFRSLTHALNQAGDRAILHVEAGDYTAATETFPLVLRDRTVQIIGTNAAQTVINAAGANRVFDLANMWGNNRIEGVTIRGGSGDYQAGGLLVVRSRLALQDCRIMHNSGSGHTDVRWGGAGMHALQAAVAISDCEFLNNSQGGGWGSWGQGGGLYAADVTGYVRDSLFTNNVAQGGGSGRPGYGGAVYLLRALLEVENSRFIRNRASYGGSSSAAGGAIVLQQGAPVLRNLLIADNTVSPAGSTVSGGGLYVHNTGQPRIENCTIVTNVNGGGLYGFDANLTVVNTILWTNTPVDFTNLTAAAFSYSRASGLTPGVQGNITDDPLFIDPAAGNYGLQSTFGQYEGDTNTVVFHAASSPAMDAGTNLAWMTAEAGDIRGFPRVHHGDPYLKTDPRVDMGAYEVWSPPPVPVGTLFMFR